MPRELTIAALQREAKKFAERESEDPEPSLYGVTDGKAIGTYFERKFRAFLSQGYLFQAGNSAKGIDFPEIGVDMKVTSITQPQSSCPFRSAKQKVFGLGYNLLIFVYRKTDDPELKTGRLEIIHTIFVDQSCTADYQMSRGLREILDRNGNAEDLIAFMRDRFLPVEEIEARQIAEELLESPPEQGYLTISNALQWRLQYARVIENAGSISGIARVR